MANGKALQNGPSVTPQQALIKLLEMGEISKETVYEKFTEQAEKGNMNEKQMFLFNQLSESDDYSAWKRGRDAKTLRAEMFSELAQEVNPSDEEPILPDYITAPVQSFFTSMGKGLHTIGAAVGLADPLTETEIEAFDALSEEKPVSSIVGEAVGESLPFLLPGGGMIRLASMPAKLSGRIIARLAASGLTGGVEGGLIQKGKGESVAGGAAVGSSVAMVSELLFPVIGKLSGKIYQRITGKLPKGTLIDNAGKPTPEFKTVLDEAGIEYEDLADDAIDFILKQKPGTDPQQVARAARFAEEGIPGSKGEITQDFAQRAKELRLYESAEDAGAESFRTFKLKQSDAVKKSLEKNFKYDVTQEETGQLIYDALTGRKTLLRTAKNDLYREAAETAEDIGGMPIFTDNIADAIPDDRTVRRIRRLKESQMGAVDDLLVEFGVKTDDEAVEAFIKTGGEIDPLSIENFEDFRAALNQIERDDPSGTIKVVTGPIKRALDNEIEEFGSVLDDVSGLPKEKLEVIKGVKDTLKKARKTVRQIKTEFSPQSLAGQLIDAKKDGVTQIVESSKVYSKLSGRASPVEHTRKLVNSLLKSGEEGKKALASLQATTILDLIDAGFGTGSRKVKGVPVFNPTAFRKRLKNIGIDKVTAIFRGNLEALKSLKNIDAIAKDLVPEAGAMPKGSASVLLDLVNKLGLATISGVAKIPGASLAIGMFKMAADPVKSGVKARIAMQGTPERAVSELFDRQYPGISAAIAVPFMLTEENNQERINENEI